MRIRPIVAVLLTTTLSCTGGEPTEIKPDFAVAACGVTVTANPVSVGKPVSTDNTALFVAKNTCGSPSGPVDFTASRTGAVASTSTITPSVIVSPGLTAGQSRNVTVAYHTGATAGNGTVVLTATRDATTPPTVSSGSQAVAVTSGPGTPPIVTTLPASAIGTTTATLNGSANPNGTTTTAWFRYWTTNPGSCTDAGGTRVPATGTVIGAGTAVIPFSQSRSGLTVRQGVYFCAIASNSAGIRFGAIGFFVPVRFPVGMFKQASDLGVPSSTPDGKHSKFGGDVLPLLSSARAAGVRIVLHVTRDNSQMRDAQGHFVISTWKADFDAITTNPTALRSYVQDGTLIGHYAIDEPFFDFTSFRVTDLEDICQYQKAKWPFVPCLVRISNIQLDDSARTQAPAGFTFRYVDAGWAQLTDFAFDKPPFNGNFQMWYETNLTAGRQRGLGLMYGFQLIEGGHEITPPGAPQGCAWSPPGTQDNCAMTDLEIDKVSNAIAALGPDQGCGVFGWQLASSGLQRDYFFGLNTYSIDGGNGIPAAMQRLWNRTAGAGLRPGLCNIRGDLPPP